MKTEPKINILYAKYFDDEELLDSDIARKDTSIRTLWMLLIVYAIISAVNKDYHSFRNASLISTLDILVGFSFVGFIGQSLIKLNALFVLKAVINYKDGSQE